jgi:hypothetical protein
LPEGGASVADYRACRISVGVAYFGDNFTSYGRAHAALAFEQAQLNAQRSKQITCFGAKRCGQ